MAKYDIIIPTLNNEKYTIALLKSIKEHSKDYRVIWIDNASTKESRDKVEAVIKDMPHFKIYNDTNLGFVKGTNQGIATSTAPYVVFQNNDTLVEAGWLDKMRQVFEAVPKAGIVGPTCTIGGGKQNRDTIAKYSPDLLTRPFTEIKGMVAFFSTMIKREVIEVVGYLSEEYGVGLADDDDYCARARQLGYKVYLRADVTIPHYHRTTFKSEVPNYEEIKAHNLAKFIAKHGTINPQFDKKNTVPSKGKAWVMKSPKGGLKIVTTDIQYELYKRAGYVVTSEH